MSDQRVHPDQPAQPHAARPRRANVMLMALVEAAGGESHRHRVRDVSSGGIRIDNAAALRPGASLIVSVGALHAIPATVQWIREGCAGLAFAEPIDPDDARKKPTAGSGSGPESAAVKQSAMPATTGAPTGSRPLVPTAGWMGDLRNAYSR